MNKLKARLRENTRFILIFGSALIILTITLTLLLEDFVREAIIRPAAYLVWLSDIVLSTIPARWYFTLISIVIVFLAINSFRHQQNRSLWENARQVTRSPHNGPIAIWQERLRNLSRGRYANAVFAEHLSQLLIRLLMTQNRMSQRDIIKACEESTLFIPDYIRTFILETVHHDIFGKSRASWLERIWRDIKTFFTGAGHIRHENNTLDLEPILKYMESELNLVH